MSAAAAPADLPPPPVPLHDDLSCFPRVWFSRCTFHHAAWLKLRRRDPRAALALIELHANAQPERGCGLEDDDVVIAHAAGLDPDQMEERVGGPDGITRSALIRQHLVKLESGLLHVRMFVEDTAAAFEVKTKRRARGAAGLAKIEENRAAAKGAKAAKAAGKAAEEPPGPAPAPPAAAAEAEDRAADAPNPTVGRVCPPPAGGGAFGALAGRLADLGYPVHPCLGKHPLTLGWQKRQEPNHRWLAREVQAKGWANVGVVCGPALFGCDIDVRDPVLAHRIDALALEHLGHSPMRIGEWPKRLRAYRSTGAWTERIISSKGRLDLLGPGMQFIAYGQHPDTKHPYYWPEGDLTDVAREDLPRVSPEALRAFLAEVRRLLPPAPSCNANSRAAAAGSTVRKNPAGLITDGRDEHLSKLAWAAVCRAIERGESLSVERLAERVWKRFTATATVENARGSGRSWTPWDAAKKVRDKLLARRNRLPCPS